MKRKLALTTLVSTAALALAACDSEDVENTPVDDVDELVVDDADQSEDDLYPVGGELSDDQQGRFDSMDRQSVSDEYDRNRDTMMNEAQGGGAMSDRSTGGDSMSGGGSDGDDSMSSSDMAGTSGTSGDGMSGSTMPSRGAMGFSYLDRNDDGKLSVAEYAIWALPTDPTEPEPNDARPPYLTPEEINEAGETFFYFDEDGDSYLSQSEFQTARASSRTP
ncbi:MAG: EF-hand domain-containing protein [Erythrobacter sp.]|nr:EF-hand domain-containing protein [Erythrobacter sp.]NCQ63612.1 EF-hand domain-containing protein [Alphaproteobacteria bacterium]